MNDERSMPASPPDDRDDQPPTQEFPVPQPPAPAGYPGEPVAELSGAPAPPQWAAATPQTIAVRLRRRDHVVLTVSVVLALLVGIGVPAVLGYMLFGDRIAAVQRLDEAAAPQGAAAPASALGSDLREGGVFLQSNNADANEVVAFARGADGKLREVGRYPTGGKGSGSFEDSATGIVLGTADGEASPTQNLDKAVLLFVVNAGSSSISVFRLKADGLEMVDHVPSGGQKPVSLTVNHGLLYVLNSGEYDNRFISGLNGDQALENCVHGQLPSVTGFQVSPEGKLSKINGSTRPLTGERESGCAQVSFTPDGKQLIVSERIAGKRKAPPAGFDKGALLVYPVRENGLLGPPQMNEPNGYGPFGFTFMKNGTMLITQQNGGFGNPGGGQVAAYNIGSDGTLSTVGEPAASTTTDPCWVVLTDDQKLAFTAAVADGGAISSFSVANDGKLTLLHRAASAPDGVDSDNDVATLGLTDMSLSRDSRYLYQMNSAEGVLYAFGVNSGNGTLAHLETHEVFDLKPFFMGGDGAPFGIAAF